MPSFTIIVPTRNRGDTLKYALQTLVAIDDDRLEILVSDNASDDQTRDIVSAVRDPRLRYVNTGRRLGMSQNWELGLGHARGDWIGYLGDDDGLLPDALSRLRTIIADTKVRAVRGALCRYSWPSLTGIGKLLVPLGRDVVVRESDAQLRRVLRGEADYLSLPALYNGGFAERALLDRARDDQGRFFRSRIPDVYSGIVLGHLTDRFAYSEMPFAVNGASIHSTGTSQFSRSSDPARKKAAQEFLQEETLPFHPAVPLNRDGGIPRSIHALVLESWYQARERFPDMPDIPPQRQLEDVLVDASGREGIAAWAEDFAMPKGLDARRALRASMLRRWLARGRAVRDRVWLRQWHSGLAPGQAIPTVADATRLAAQVIASPPAPAALPLRNAGRVARKLLARPAPAGPAGLRSG